MGHVSKKPSYDLDVVQSLVRSGKFRYSERVRRWLHNHGYPPGDTVKGTLLSLVRNDFLKSDPLEKRPGTFGDIYRTFYEGEEWYVKFFLDDDGALASVVVWSCCPDGMVH